MYTITATDVENNFDQIMDQALNEPVLVQNQGRNSVVILNYEEFDQLRRAEDAYWGMRAMEAAKSGFLTHEETMRRIQQRFAEIGEETSEAEVF